MASRTMPLPHHHDLAVWLQCCWHCSDWNGRTGWCRKRNRFLSAQCAFCSITCLHRSVTFTGVVLSFHMELFIFKMHYDQFFINCGAGEKGDNFLVDCQESWPAAPQWLGFAGVNCYRASFCTSWICSGTFLLSNVFTFWHICTNLSAECRTTQIREANVIHKSISTNTRPQREHPKCFSLTCNTTMLDTHHKGHTSSCSK